MATRKLRCAKCSRSFSMPAHLARHMNTIHSTASRKPAAKKRLAAAAKRAPRSRKTSARKAVRRKVARTGIAQFPGGGASRLVGDMQSYLGELSRQRVAIDKEAAAITGALKLMGAAAPKATRFAAKRGRPPGRPPGRPLGRPLGRPAGRPARPGSLKSYIVRVLRQRAKPMSPNAIATAVAKSGYKSKAKDLAKAVSNSIPELKSVKKVRFGLYKA